MLLLSARLKDHSGGLKCHGKAMHLTAEEIIKNGKNRADVLKREKGGGGRCIKSAAKRKVRVK